MVADLSDGKYWAISSGLYAFFMFIIWKFQLGASTINLTKIRIIISIAFLPICFGMIYFMSED